MGIIYERKELVHAKVHLGLVKIAPSGNILHRILEDLTISFAVIEIKCDVKLAKFWKSLAQWNTVEITIPCPANALGLES